MKRILILTAILIFAFSYGQTPITDANFSEAISTCLSTNPIDGMCSESEYGAIPDWDVSNVTDMDSAFYDRNDFNADISAWDVSNVTNMQGMLYEAYEFNQPIGDWDVSNVTNMEAMFFDASSFNQPIGNWDVSSVTNMRYMLFYADSFNQPIEDWDVSNVTNMQWMLCAAYFNQPIGVWDVSNVTDMSNMLNTTFYFNQPIGDWDVSNVTNMQGMLAGAFEFNQDISNWCVTNITSEPTYFSSGSPLIEINKPVWGTCPSLGIDDLNQLDISIYPNPTSDKLYIDGLVVQDVIIYSVLGKEVVKISNQNSIDVSSLSKGVYFIKVSDGINASIKKFIKD